MKLHELKSAAGSKKTPKRVGRGTGSGLSGDARKGEKGQNAKPGGGVRPGFEGGQTPLYRRLPKRGSTNIFAKQHVSINAGRLNILESGTEITPEILLEGRVINKVKDGVKILGSGTLEKSLTVRERRFSKSTAGKIEAVGGKIGVI